MKKMGSSLREATSLVSCLTQNSFDKSGFRNGVLLNDERLRKSKRNRSDRMPWMGVEEQGEKDPLY